MIAPISAPFARRQERAPRRRCRRAPVANPNPYRKPVPFAVARRQLMSDPHVQRALSLHGQQRPLDPRRIDPSQGGGQGGSLRSRQAASPRARSIPSPSRCSTSSITQLTACARKAGTNSQLRAPRKWILFSRSATMPLVKPVPYGPASRHGALGHRGPRRRRRHRHPERSGFHEGRDLHQEPYRRLCPSSNHWPSTRSR